jgi:hypothetical protein
LFVNVEKHLFAKKQSRENMTIIELQACLAIEDKKKQLVLNQGQLDSLVLA